MQKAIIYTLTLLSYCIIQTAIAQTDPTPGQNRLDSLQHLLSITKQDTAKINILNNLAQQYVDRGEYDKANAATQEALEKSNSTGYKKFRGDSYNKMGLVYLSQEEYASARKCFFKAMKKMNASFTEKAL